MPKILDKYGVSFPMRDVLALIKSSHLMENVDEVIPTNCECRIVEYHTPPTEQAFVILWEKMREDEDI